MFGAWVEIENLQKGIKKKLRIVGYEELLGNSDYISMDSPVAKSLMKKSIGDQVVVKTKIGDMVWRINSIQYQK